MGKKFFLFSLFAFLAAGFWFGGASLATTSPICTDTTPGENEASLTVGESTYYCSLSNAIGAATAGDTVKLLKPITLTETITIDKDIILDLNNQLITNNSIAPCSSDPSKSCYSPAISIADGTVTVENGNISGDSYALSVINGKGIIKSGTYKTTKAGSIMNAIGSSSELTILDGTFDAQEAAIMAFDGAKITIEGGTFTTVDNFVVGTNGTSGRGNNTIIINRGTFNGNIETDGYVACGIYAANNDTIKVNGGTFNITNGVGVAIRAGKVEISDETTFKVTGDGTKGKVGDSRVVLPSGTKVAIDLDAKYPGLDNNFSVKSKENKNDKVVNQLYVIEKEGKDFTSETANNVEITKKSDENKIEIKGGTFDVDVSEYTANDGYSVKTSEGRYEVKALTPTKFDMSSNKNITIPVVLSEDGKNVLLEETKAVLGKETGLAAGALLTQFNGLTTQEALNEVAKVETVLEQKLLFFKQQLDTPVGKYKIGVFTESIENKPFSDHNKFIGGTEYNEGDIVFDNSDSAKVDPFSISNWNYVKKYNAIGDNGYALYAEDAESNGNQGWFYAPRMYKVTFNTNGSTDTFEAQKVALTDGKATNPGTPTKGGVGFKFWSLSNDADATEYNFGTEVSNDIILYAIYGTEQDGAFNIIFKNGDIELQKDVLAKDVIPTYLGETPTKAEDSTCNTYEFKEWTPTIAAVSADATYTATFTCTSKKSSSYSGGGGSSRTSTTKTDDTKKAEETTKDETKVDEQKADETKTDETKTSEEAKAAADAQALKDGYSQEFIDAYNFARENNITTKDTIREADMDAPLTRIAMAKMLSQYAINVLGKTPDTSVVVPTFPDVDAKLDADYNNGVTLAYQLGIMGIGIEKFRPFDLVTRAEFGTALSRMLFGLEDGQGDEWYKTHLDKLMTEKIITNDNPQLKELRGYVMIMLMRSAKQ